MIEFDESANASASPEQGLSGLPNGQFIYGTPGFSKRERACIDLLYPDSGLKWLDEMIRVRKREEIERAALGKIYCQDLIKDACKIANAMLYEGEKV